MNWILVVLAVALFVGWLVLRLVLAVSFGVMNLLWMIALLLLVIWGVQWFA